MAGFKLPDKVVNVIEQLEIGNITPVWNIHHGVTTGGNFPLNHKCSTTACPLYRNTERGCS